MIERRVLGAPNWLSISTVFSSRTFQTLNKKLSTFPMSEISPQLVKELREKTNAGMMDCKRALSEAGGDIGKAEDILRKKGIANAGKKSARAAKEGVVASYIHLQGKVGVLVEINCETDFVARNEGFREFVKDITLHIAAAQPQWVSRDQVPADVIAKEREIAKAQVQGKPANIIDKIADGKIEKFYTTVCLIDQAFIKNPDQTIGDLVKSKMAELGENILIRRFTRYMVGEDLDGETTPAAE
jgi:elongation factor Ts